MKIGDRIYVHGYVDEIRKDCVIVRNDGGYFGTVKSEIVEAQKAEDIVSVVRCKDCAKWDRKDGTLKDVDDKEWHNCKTLCFLTMAYFYCADAERREK